MGRLISSLCSSLAILGAMFSVATAGTTDFPNASITMVNPYSAGGGVDTTARIVEPIMSKELGQQIILDYRPGGNGFIGGGFVAGSKPDGYTLLVSPSGPILNVLKTAISYKAPEAFAPVGRLVTTPAFLVVAESSPITSVEQLVALGRDPSKHVTYAHSGTGTGTHMAAGQLAEMTGAKFVGVPYNGVGPQVADVLSGVVDFNFMPAADTLPRLGQGLRALAVTTAERSALAPDVPTLAEAGVPGYEFSQWYGIYAPAGTPQPVLEKLNAAINASLNDEGVKAALLKLGVVPDPTTPEEFAEVVAKQAKVDNEIATKLGLIAE